MVVRVQARVHRRPGRTAQRRRHVAVVEVDALALEELQRLRHRAHRRLLLIVGDDQEDVRPLAGDVADEGLPLASGPTIASTSGRSTTTSRAARPRVEPKIARATIRPTPSTATNRFSPARQQASRAFIQIAHKALLNSSTRADNIHACTYVDQRRATTRRRQRRAPPDAGRPQRSYAQRPARVRGARALASWVREPGPGAGGKRCRLHPRRAPPVRGQGGPRSRGHRLGRPDLEGGGGAARRRRARSARRVHRPGPGPRRLLPSRRRPRRDRAADSSSAIRSTRSDGDSGRSPRASWSAAPG